jgi:Domain of unknown function (DUF4397)
MRIRRTRGAHAKAPSLGVRRAGLVVAAAAALVALPLVAPVSAVATGTPTLSGTGVVTLIHAVPGLVADVAVDGKTVLTGFTASRVTDPVTLSAGSHTVALTADNGPDAGKVVLTATLDIVAGTTSTAVVGLTPDGKPKAFVFPEMPIAVPPGKAGVVRRQVAASAPVTLVVDGSVLPIGALANGASVTTDAPAGTHQVVVKSASGATQLGAQPATLQADRVTTLYLIGSSPDKSMSWVATTRLASALTSLSAVPTGDGSTAEPVMTDRTNVSIGMAAAIAVTMGAAAFLITRRRARQGAVA